MHAYLHVCVMLEDEDGEEDIFEPKTEITYDDIGKDINIDDI